MEWMWWVGAALAALCSVACGLDIGRRVARGIAHIWQPGVLGWAVGFHGLVGVASLMMIVAAKGR